MRTLRGIAQLSNCLLTHMLLAYWRKLLFPECVEGVFAKVHSYGECSERFTMASCLGQNGIEESTMVFTLAADVDQRPVVIDGAGTLGRRIATVYTAGGSDVRIFDLSAEQREAARDYVEEH